MNIAQPLLHSLLLFYLMSAAATTNAALAAASVLSSGLSISSPVRAAPCSPAWPLSLLPCPAVLLLAALLLSPASGVGCCALALLLWDSA
ncbi:hypothetical protein ULF88_21115 [Halopseudomonas pachastrellae]|nr:hypothetical protein [Halopseudomonas pachastrellae]